MIFKFRKSKPEPEAGKQEEENEYALFQGALDGTEVNLQANAKLAQAGLVPAKELITDALIRRAHMIRLETKGNVAGVTMVVDGVPYPGGRMPAQRALALTQMLKLLSGRDIKVRDQPQSGGIKVEFQQKPYEIRVDTIPVKGEPERLSVRIYDPKERDALKKPDDVGFTDELKTKIREMGARKRGLILVCGPPYSGTTTTVYVVLRSVDAYIYSVYTNADTTGHDLFGITVSERNPGESLEASLMRMIRAEADLIFLDPLRDAATAQLVFQLQDQVAFLTEMTAKDPAAAVQKLIEWVGDPKKVAEGLSGIITQKLLRRLCDQCREAYRPNPKLLAKMGLPPETNTLYRPPKPRPEPPPGAKDKDEEEYQPCKKCGGVGYFGRMGMYELIEMTDPIRALIADGLKDPAALRQTARKEKMQTLQRDGVRLVLEGKTSLEELQRVFKAPA